MKNQNYSDISYNTGVKESHHVTDHFFEWLVCQFKAWNPSKEHFAREIWKSVDINCVCNESAIFVNLLQIKKHTSLAGQH